MTTIVNAARTWRTLALLVLAALLVSIAPSTASATARYTGPVADRVGSPARSNYIGYAKITGVGGCPANAVCIWANPQPIYGYSWTGATWLRYKLTSGRYYVSPYTGTWRWVYTRMGWLAVGDAVFTVA